MQIGNGICPYITAAFKALILRDRASGPLDLSLLEKAIEDLPPFKGARERECMRCLLAVGG